MKKVVALVLVALAAASCSQTEKGAATGAVAGAAIGGLATGNIQGVAAGALIGGAAGTLIGAATEPGKCRYRDRYGREYISACR